MRRRDFIALAGRAQQPMMPVIGLLSTRSLVTDAPLIAVFQQGLRETGFVGDRNVVIDYRWAEGQYDRLPALLADLVQRQVAVIVTIGGNSSALAAKAASTTIPIVFLTGSDPVRSGLVSSLHRPGGNLTGVSALLEELQPKRLELLRELRPKADTIAVLVNPKYPEAESQVNDIHSAARGVGQKIVVLNASTVPDIDAAFAALAQMRADALLVATDAFFFTRVQQFVVLTARHAIPTIFWRREFPAAGGLMSYGTNIEEIYRLGGVYVGRILKGEKPRDLPIHLSTKFELVVNLAMVRALALELPPTLLARADEVIE